MLLNRLTSSSTYTRITLKSKKSKSSLGEALIAVPEAIFFKDIALILLAALAGGLLAHRLHQPILVGYILGGILISPFTPGPSVTDIHTIDLFAEIGVILLMFTIGLEFSLKDLLSMRWVAVVGGPIGILLIIGLSVWVGSILGWPPYQALFIGCVVSVASTAAMAKMLLEREELTSQHGRVMVSIALVEDLAMVVMIALLPALKGFHLGQLPQLFLGLGKALVVLSPFYYLAHKAVPRLMERVARTQSMELFILVALAISFITAVFSYSLGLSLALGAFLAGLLISESEFTHETLARIIPLRDIFVPLFFVSVGLLMNPRVILQNLSLLSAMLAFIVLGKGLVRAIVVALFRYPLRTALLVGIGLAQIGEFSFVLAKMGRDLKLISSELYNVTLAASLLSLLLNSFLFRAAPRWIEKLSRIPAFRPLVLPAMKEFSKEPPPLKDHVILCGFGRVGGVIGATLEQLKIPFIVIDLDPAVIAMLKRKGIPSVYGDAANELVLRRAKPRLATLAVITLPDFFRVRQAIQILRKHNPTLPILARAHRDLHRKLFYEDGVAQVIQPEFEGGLEIVRHILTHLRVSDHEVEEQLKHLRQERYNPILQEWLRKEEPFWKRVKW